MRPGFVVLAGVALLALSGCKMKGQGKSTQPDFETFKTEHPLRASSDTVRSGALELRLREATLEEYATVIGTQESWRVRLRGVVVASEEVPVSVIEDAFTLIAKDGSVWRGKASVAGDPPHLAPGVDAEVVFATDVGRQTLDGVIEAFTFQGVRVQLSR